VGLQRLGIALDGAANESAVGVERRVSPPDSQTAVWVIPTDEELLIARDTVRAIEPEG
jgi:acetate kinase